MCGDNSVNCDAGGPCGLEERAALEITDDPAAINTSLVNYGAVDPSQAGFCGQVLNSVLAQAAEQHCFPVGDP